MYTPDHFKIADEERGYGLIHQHPFGMLICPTNGGVPEIAHIPFVLDRERKELRCHVARANPIARLLADGSPVVAVFTGPHAYVSPSFYEDPAHNVPTWNYAAVHVHGRVERVTAKDEIVRDLGAMTSAYEAGAASPWSLAAADPAHVDKLLGGVTAYAVAIDIVETKFKMSQNRPVPDRVRVVAALRGRGGVGDAAVAQLVEELNCLAAK